MVVQIVARVGIGINPNHPANGGDVGGVNSIVAKPDIGRFEIVEKEGRILELVDTVTGGEEEMMFGAMPSAVSESKVVMEGGCVDGDFGGRGDSRGG